MMRLLLLLLMMALPVAAAPDLSDADRQRLADGTTDGDDVLDQQDGLYVLLRNASAWQGDDFSGDAGAATAPPPDYDYIKNNPQKARGNAYLLDGWVVQHDRYPSTENHERNKLTRSGDPAWGDQVTRWTLVTEKGNPDATIIVLFNDPRGQIAEPEKRSKVRVAARFYKLWTIKDAAGKPFTYPVFVGGAAEVVAQSSGSGGSSPMNIVLVCILVVAGAFFVIRHMLNRGGGGTMMRQRLDEIRMRRERLEQAEAGEEPDDAEDSDDADEALPKDPVEALSALRQKHDAEAD